MLRRLARATAAYGRLGLFGPCAMSLLPQPMNQLGMFIYEMTALVWPTWGMAVIEVNVGPARAYVVAALANVFVFVVLGIALAVLGAREIGVMTFSAFVSVALCYWAWLEPDTKLAL